MTSFSEDMRRRGMVPGSRTLSMETELAGARLGRLLHVSPSEEILVIKRFRLADGETMAIETLHLPKPLVPGLAGEGSRRLVLRALPRPLRHHDRERHPGDRAHGDERGGVGGARRAAPLAGVPLRAHEPRRAGPHGRVRPVGLPGRPLPDRHRAQPPAGLSPLTTTGLVCDNPAVANWYRPIRRIDHRTHTRRPQRHESVEVARRRLRETWMRSRIFVAAVAAVALGVVAATAERKRAARTGKQDHRVAPGRRAVRLAGRRRGRERAVPEGSPRHDGRRPVPELGRPPAEVRRNARGRQHARRDRDGQHGDDEVHGGRRVRRHHARSSRRSTNSATG